MNPENTRKIMGAFPRLYRGRAKPLQESLMSWGFACGDGWFDLIWSLSQAIEDVARQEGLDPQSEGWPEVIQVKDKLGTLRFRLANASEAMWQLIEEASEASAHTCEVCGLKDPQVDYDRATDQMLCRAHSK